MRQFSKCLVVAVLTFSLGLHWALLQTVAWTGMVLQYSQTTSFKDALAKTFDGNHPCPICKMVSEGKKSEQKDDVQQPLVKVDFFLVSLPKFVFPPLAKLPAAAPCVISASRGETPPTPPPRELPV